MHYISITHLSLCLTLAVVLSVDAMPAWSQDRVIAILCADTLSPDIRDDMRSNLFWMSDLLEKNIPTDKLKITTISDKDYSAGTVVRVIRQMKVHPTDALFYFYSGHGYYEPGVGSYFTPPPDKGRRLYLRDVRNELLTHKARLTVSVVDSCSVIPGGVNAAPADDPRKATEVSTLFQRLFFETNGTFHLNSSKPGEYAICRWFVEDQDGRVAITNGSLFTSVLHAELTNNQRSLGWRDIYDATRSKVRERFGKIYPDSIVPLGGGRSTRQKTQTVWAFENEQEVR
jgi:hypothetical protein